MSHYTDVAVIKYNQQRKYQNDKWKVYEET